MFLIHSIQSREVKLTNKDHFKKFMSVTLKLNTNLILKYKERYHKYITIPFDQISISTILQTTRRARSTF